MTQIIDKVRDYWADLIPETEPKPGYCACPEPLTDGDLDVTTSADVDDDFCWRCKLPVEVA